MREKEHATTYLKFQTRQSLLPVLNLVTHSVQALVVRVHVEYEVPLESVRLKL